MRVYRAQYSIKLGAFLRSKPLQSPKIADRRRPDQINLLPLIPTLTAHLEFRAASSVEASLFVVLDPKASFKKVLLLKLDELSWDFARDQSGANNFAAMLQGRTLNHVINGVSRLRRLNLRILHKDGRLVQNVSEWRKTLDLEIEVELRFDWRVQKLEKPREPLLSAQQGRSI